jgi:hypothetical protein
VGDNASSNDGELIKGLNLHPNINLSFDERLRCAGHIFNLVVNATLYGRGISKWEAELAAAAPQDQFEKFRQLGVVGKLHNFVNAVCASHKRRELFTKIQREAANEEDVLYTHSTLSLRQDGGVRWHSVYLMMLRCLELKDHIQRFIRALKNDDNFADDITYDPLTDGLTDEEWDDAQELVNFLQAPYEMTKKLEGNNSSSGFGSIWQTLPNMQALWIHYTEATEPTHKSQYFKSAVSFGLEKLNSYFNTVLLTPDISYYAVATALHPKLRMNWFKTHWKNYPHWYKKAEAGVRRVFKNYVEDEVEEESQLSQQAPPPSRRKLPGNNTGSNLYKRTMEVDLHLLTNAKNKRQKRTNQLDEYFDALYFDLTVAGDKELHLIESDDAWGWWRHYGQTRYPILFKIATNFLSIPATSCECERCFSKARRTISDDRNMLSAATIEACQLQKSWIQRGVVKSSLKELAVYVENVDKKRATPVSSSAQDVVAASFNSQVTEVMDLSQSNGGY